MGVIIIANITATLSRSQHHRIDPSHHQGEEGQGEAQDIGPKEVEGVGLQQQGGCILTLHILQRRTTLQKRNFSLISHLTD